MAFSSFNSISSFLVNNITKFVSSYIYNFPALDASLVLYYPLDTSINSITPNYASGLPVYDASFTNAIITTTNNSFVTGVGDLSLNNTMGSTASSYVRSDTSFNLVPSRGLSIACWFSCSGQLNTTGTLFTLVGSSNSNTIEVDISGSNMIYSAFSYLSGLVLWLDANSTDITSNSWPDKSGLGNNLTGTGVFTTYSNLFNNKKTVRLMGTGNATSNVSLSSMPITIFIVFNMSNNSGTYNYLAYNPTIGGLQMAVNNLNQFFINKYGGGGTVTNPLIQLGTSGLYILSIRLTGTGNNYTNAFIKYNGTTYVNQTLSNTVISGTLQIQAAGSAVYISEYLYYNTALTDTQMQQVEQYLILKWNISV